MIGLQCLPVGFVGDNDVVGGVHDTREGDGGAVFDEFAPGFLGEGAGSYFVGEVFDSDEFNVFIGHVL